MGGIFSTGRTFGLYVGQLKTACQLLEIDTAWRGDSFRAIAKGIANKPSAKERCHNSVSPSILDRIIRAESCESELAGV